jgi:uncharacterized membrane protein HdeD (DUF308 family)
MTVAAGGVLMIAGVVTIAAPFSAIREITEGRKTLSRVLGLSLVAIGALLVTKPMAGPLVNGKYFGWPPLL